MSRSMRILGIDPGLQIAGFGVIDVEGQTLRYVASGATIVGGCCGISPEDIGALSQALAARS